MNPPCQRATFPSAYFAVVQRSASQPLLNQAQYRAVINALRQNPHQPFERRTVPRRRRVYILSKFFSQT